MMASGLLSAALFLFMSHARPLVTLAPRRPPATIVCTYMAFTVFAQVYPWHQVGIKSVSLSSPAFSPMSVSESITFLSCLRLGQVRPRPPP